LILTRQQKELIVVKLAEEGHSTRQIAKAAHVSLKDIGTILRRYTGEEEATTSEEIDKSLSTNSKAFKLFKEKKSMVDVAITLNVDADEVLELFHDYSKLMDLDKLMSIYREFGDDIHLIERLYRELKWHGLANREDIFNILQQEEKIKNLDKVLYETAGELGRLNSIKMQLDKDIEERMKMMDNYDSVMVERYQETS
jgi:hypothetical protein